MNIKHKPLAAVQHLNKKCNIMITIKLRVKQDPLVECGRILRWCMNINQLYLKGPPFFSILTGRQIAVLIFW